MTYIGSMKKSPGILPNYLLSVVIPVYNEEECIEACINEVTSTLKKAQIEFELIIVNDGSSDRTKDICLNLKTNYNFRLIDIPVNSGHMAAITAGLEASTGQYIATMDADLQDPPNDLVEMFRIIHNSSTEGEENIDVVQAFRVDRSVDSYFKKSTAAIYYKLMERVIGVKIIHHAADFRIITREVVSVLLSLPERNRIYRLLIPKLGFAILPFPITRAKRYAGRTKYSLNKMFKLSVDSLFAFSYKPLQVFAFLGFTSSAFFLLASIVTLLISIFFVTVPGWPSLILLLLSANSFLFAGLGLLGEYVGRIYEIVQARPIVIWKEKEGVGPWKDHNSHRKSHN
jgi:glycosyltransferase involved in cell wall biosynthesis